MDLDSYVQYVESSYQLARDRKWRADEVEWALFTIGKDVDRKVTQQ